MLSFYLFFFLSSSLCFRKGPFYRSTIFDTYAFGHEACSSQIPLDMYFSFRSTNKASLFRFT